MLAELYLTDGTQKIDLLGGNRHGIGVSLTKMILSRPTREPAGIFRQAYGETIETYEIRITDLSHDGLAARQQQVDRMLEMAKNYFETSAEQTLVWLVSRAADEQNPRYAICYDGTLQSYGDIYNEPFSGQDRTYTLDGLILGISRSTWQANPPPAPACAAATNAVRWNPNTPVWTSVRTLTNVQSLFVTNTSALLAGAANIERSGDNGGVWTVELTGGDATVRFWDFIQVGSRIWTVAGETSGAANAVCGIYYSDDDGLNWAQHTASLSFYSLVYRPVDNTIFFGGDGEVRYIQDGGALTVATTAPLGNVKALAISSLGTVVLGDDYGLWYILPGAVGAVQAESNDLGPFIVIVAVEDYLIAGSALYLSISRDDGLTWTIYWKDWGVDTLFKLANGYLLASKSATTLSYISSDGGFSWQTFTNTFTGNPIRAFEENSDDYIFAGAVSTIYRRIATDKEVLYGPGTPSCNPIYIANHRIESNWTHIFVFDTSAATYTSVTPANVVDNITNNSDFLAFPSPVGVGDILYIGMSTALTDNGPFSNIYIELTERNYTLVLALEYWNGAAWITLTTDYVNDNTKSLKRSGIIVWHLASSVSMTATAVNSITAYWLRVRVTATGTQSTLLPRIRNIYMANKPYIEIDDLAGDIPALAKLSLTNELDNGFPSILRRETQRILLGLRSVSRGADFTAYINLASKQNPKGITIAGGGGTLATANTTAAAGQVFRVTPGFTNTWVPSFYILLDSNMSQQYTGTFQVYLRINRSTAPIGTIKVRLVVENFVRYLNSYLEGNPGEDVTIINIAADDYARLFYMGQFSISPQRFTDAGDTVFQTRITIETFVTSDTATGFDAQELILMPADEWIGDFSTVPGSTLYLRGEDTLDIDSATFPKRVLRCILRADGSNLVTAVWGSSSSGIFALSPAQRQRLWMLVEASGSSPHTFVHRAKLWFHARWLGLRGKD